MFSFHLFGLGKGALRPRVLLFKLYGTVYTFKHIVRLLIILSTTPKPLGFVCVLSNLILIWYIEHQD